MKILVIDDKTIHIEAARAQFADHKLTTAGSYDEGKRLIYGSYSAPPQYFDAVLVDLLMPASGEAQVQDGLRFVGQEMPIGIFLALAAAMNGAKYVGVFTDTNHHFHPAAHCLDLFHGKEGSNSCLEALDICGARVILSNNYNWIEDNGGKDWKKLLDYIVDPTEQDRRIFGAFM